MDAPAPDFNEGEMTREAYRNLVAERGRLYVDPWPADLEANWESVSAALGRMRDGTVRAGVRLLVVLIPDETQLEPSLQEVVLAAYPGRRLDFSRPQRMISAFCGGSGIPVLDLLPAFRRARSAGETLYLPANTHWNSAGQRIAAYLIAQRLAGHRGKRHRS